MLSYGFIYKVGLSPFLYKKVCGRVDQCIEREGGNGDGGELNGGDGSDDGSPGSALAPPKERGREVSFSSSSFEKVDVF